VEDLGVTAPKPPLTLSKLLDLVLQILGITATKLRKKVEDVLGKTATSAIEKAWGYISALISGGLGGLWEKIKGQLGDLWQSVIGGISQWVTVNLIEAGIEKLVELSNPAGAIIEAIRTIYKTVKFLVEKANKIIQLVDAVVKSISSIAAGRIDAAADWIEGALARSVSTLIGFFAEWLGFDDPGPQIRAIVLKIQKQVDTAIDWVVAQGVAIAKGIAGALGLGEKPDTRTDGEKTADLNSAMNEADALCHADDADAATVQKKLPAIQKMYRLKELSLDPGADGTFTLKGSINPTREEKEKLKPGDIPSHVEWGPENAAGGTSMIADPLVPGLAGGSVPREESSLWQEVKPDKIKRPRASDQKEVRLYVRGHLLNHNLGGPGTNKNLTPITYDANHEHLVQVEQPLKELFAAKKKEPVYVKYTVRVLGAAGGAATEGVVPAETQLTAGFDCEWYEVEPDGPSKFKTKSNGAHVTRRVIPNVPPFPHSESSELEEA
jgi:DNA/RNA non-specific endonuclease